MPYLLLGFGILLLLLALGWQFQRASPSSLARWVRRAGVVLAVGLGGYLIVTGRVAQALPALVAGALLLARLGRIGGSPSSSGGVRHPSGNVSEVTTTWLRARLDHDSGEVGGTVLRGAFAGRELAELGESDLLALYLEALREDGEGARLIEAFLDRGPFAGTWRGRMAREAASSGGAMTVEEAHRVLGVGRGASEAEIKEAHRRLMVANHPDHGGSAYLAAKINEARDLLLGHMGRT